MRSRVGPIGTIAVCEITRAHVTARVVDLPAFAGSGLSHTRAMVLGLDVLKGMRVSVDVSGRRVWIAASSCR